MKQRSKLTQGRLLASTIIAGSALLSSPAFAQVEPTTEETVAETTTADDETIIITGTLIQNPNLVAVAPVTSMGEDEIDLQQTNVAEELLRELPGAVPSIGSAVNNGQGGASYVDLRGLGSNRNIVLLDGNRLVPSNQIGRVDLNNIPLALIQRVDSLTGAAVTTYGADAITGVVNFITRRNFAGLEVNASEQITEQGDGNTMRIDATIGANFDDGRGNAVISIGYQEADAVYQGARDFSIVQISSYTGGGAGSGTSVPSRFSGTRPLTAAGVPNTAAGTANGGLRQINAAGQLVPTFQLFNFNPYNVFQTPFERFNIYGQAQYEVTDDIEVYTRGLFSKNTVESIIAPSGSFGSPYQINLNNPFLPATARAQFCAFDVNPVATIYTPRFTPAECAAAATATGPADPNYRVIGGGGFVAFDVNQDTVIDPGEGYNPNPTVTLNRRTTEAGPRVSNFQTTVFDYRVGMRGNLTESLEWDLGGAYGESENIQTQTGYILTSRTQQSLLVNGTAANPVCQNPANGCVPADWFGPEGALTPEAITYLSAASTNTFQTTLSQVRGTISGDFGWTIPWASTPIGMAIGGEFRQYGAFQSGDLLSQTPGELGGAGGGTPTVDGSYNVYEAFGEVIAPLIEDAGFIDALTLEAGLRYSDYTIQAPGSPGFDTWTWKVGGSLDTNVGLRFRGNYNRAVRAPNIGELFTPLFTGLTNLGIDPCAGAGPTTNANLRAICIAQGAPAGTIGSIANPTAAQANAVFGGNINLQPETANTWTAGFVFQPDFIPGFSLSLDYYNILVTDAITGALPGDAIAACFGNVTAASAADPACTVIRRNPNTGGLDGTPATTPGLFLPTTNAGRLFTDGFDLIANYRRDMGFADLSLGFVGNWTQSSKFQASPTSLNRECVGFYSVNCSFTGSIQPEFQFSQRTTLTFGNVDVSLLWRYIHGVDFEPAQLAADAAAADAANRNAAGVLLPLADQGCPDFNGADPGGCMVEEEFRHIGSEHYFDLSTRFAVSDALSLTLSVQNLLDNQPKVVGNTLGSTTYNSGNIYPSTYDSLGRRYAIGARLRF